VAAALIACGADANARSYRGATPLHLAARFGRVGVTQVLLDAGADVNAAATGYDGMPPLHVAARFKHRATIRALFAAGASPDVRDDRGRTPVQLTGEPRIAAELAAAAMRR
jgi:ankyrin repeat protein